MRMLAKILMPQTAMQKFWYMMDGISIGIFTISQLEVTQAYMQLLVLGATFITISITIVIKIYDLRAAKQKHEESIAEKAADKAIEKFNEDG